MLKNNIITFRLYDLKSDYNKIVIVNNTFINNWTNYSPLDNINGALVFNNIFVTACKDWKVRNSYFYNNISLLNE